MITACFIAIIPLAKLLAWGTEELALYVGEVVGGLLNATCEPLSPYYWSEGKD